jgi:hypothetical protein
VSEVLEKKWVRWSIAGGMVFTIAAVISIFFFMQYLEKKKIEERIEAQRQAERDYEDKFRAAMTRIYQNLKLAHFLAAYKNLEYLPEPKKSDPLKVEEYLDVLTRVGNGLIASQLLKEAESVFVTIRSFQGQIPSAMEALGKIESKRKVESAKFFYAQGEQMLAQKRYREANLEYEKSRLEIRSIQILGFDDVSELLAKLKPKLIEARFYSLIEEAELGIKFAEKLLKDKKFRQTDEAMSQAAIILGKAAYLKPEDAKIKELRDRVYDLDGELGYLLPNKIPIWNAYSREDIGKKEHFFSLVGYELDSAVNKDHQVKIALQYLMNSEDEFFIVRYRIYFFTGRDAFNGHFILTDSRIATDKARSVVYMQELPDDLRKAQIKRIEVKVFNQNDQLVSRVTRAFRRVSS